LSGRGAARATEEACFAVNGSTNMPWYDGRTSAGARGRGARSVQRRNGDAADRRVRARRVVGAWAHLRHAKRDTWTGGRGAALACAYGGGAYAARQGDVARSGAFRQDNVSVQPRLTTFFSKFCN
jgi:hypothetical protein